MTKKARLRYWIGQATRRNAAGGPRTAELLRAYSKYKVNLTCVGGLRSQGIFYSGGDYWN
jgi:hypothetical protein